MTAEVPAVLQLYPFQQRFIDDTARLKLWIASRQIGKSTTATADVVLDVIRNWQTPRDWNLMSRSQRQARELLLKVRKHAKAINRYIVDVLRGPAILLDKNIGNDRLVFENGCTIEAMPCDPDTTVGDTVNWLLDEFDLYPWQREIFAVIKPSIMHGLRLMITSSPRRRDGVFYEIIDRFKREGLASGWSVHRTTIEDAIRDGLHPKDGQGRPLSFEEFYAQEVRDMGEDMFQQEYMCQFIDKLAAYLTYDLVRSCQNQRCFGERPLESLRALDRELFVGMDPGRSHDSSVIWVVSKRGEFYWTEAVYTFQNTAFDEQERFMRQLLATGRVAGACIENNGLGMPMAETLERAFPGVVESVTATNAFVAEIAGRVRAAMQCNLLWIPRDEDIVTDFTSIRRVVTDAGNVRIAAPRTSFGHGDRFRACCLAVHAAATIEPFELVMAG